MLLCKECRKTIANVGNPTVHYSTCIDCGKKKWGKEEDDDNLLESLRGSNPDDGSWKGR